MKADKQQLAAKLANIEQETLVREHQLQSEQARLKELQLNIQMLDDHTSTDKSSFSTVILSAISDSMKRDHHNAEQKYEQEKSQLIHKFERTKQQWTDVFKPQFVLFSHLVHSTNARLVSDTNSPECINISSEVIWLTRYLRSGKRRCSMPRKQPTRTIGYVDDNCAARRISRHPLYRWQRTRSVDVIN